MNRQALTALLWLVATTAPAGAVDSPPGNAASGSIVGGYELPAIGLAADGRVLTADNRRKSLYELMGDKPVLLSFIYTTCSDAGGCPLATQVLHKISRRLQARPALQDQVRMLTLSFNPQHDTPQVMREYAASIDSGKLDWQFLTTASEQDLQPILDGYRQPVQKLYDSQGRFTGGYSHLLRVYLIDAGLKIRNIYSTDFLNADAVIRDIETLLAVPVPKTAAPAVAAVDRYRPGDDKSNYRQPDYRTRSVALAQRQGQAADLLAYAQSPPLGLPALPSPADNPPTSEKIALGRKLFYDRRLSLNNTFSCAMCHIPEQGFANNEMATAVGVEGRTVRRNAPTLYNVGYARLLFHDGRENSLEQQVWGPLLARNEMANPSIGFVVDKIRASADYRGLFEQAFHKPAGMETIGQALASYERTLNAADSAFDRWYFGKQAAALSAPAQKGYALFTGKAGCSACHGIQENYALFTDQQRHNTGIGYRQAIQPAGRKQRLQLAPGVFADVDGDVLRAVAAPRPGDLGYYEISQNPADRWAYKTPSLRNIALTAPYMHDGSLSTLEEVLQFYNQGGAANENLSPLLRPLHLNGQETAELLAFLESLTGGNVEKLVADGYAAPVGEAQ
ncbi:MAG: cytochrome c peroxidase [Methylococcales bacterium]|nr:cytochrome c peroxidase [Methylococcales bacterium]